MHFWSEILRLVRPYSGYAILSIASNFFAVVFGLVSLTMLLPFLDLLFDRSLVITQAPALTADPSSINLYVQYLMSEVILNRGKEGALAFISLVVILLFFAKNLFRYLGLFFMSPLRNGIVRDLRDRLYLRSLILPLSFYSDRRAGDVISRMSHDVQEIEWSVLSFLIMFFREPVAVLIYLTALMLINPWLTLMALVLVPLAGYVIHLVSKRLLVTAGQGQEKIGVLTSILEETIQGIRVIKSFNAMAMARERYQKANQAYTRLLTRVYRQRDLSNPLTEILVVLVLISVMWYGGRQVLDPAGKMDAGLFLLYLAVFSQVIPPAKSLITAYYHVRKGEASMTRVRELLDADEVITEAPGARDIHTFSREICFEGVSFAYDHEPILHDINLVIRKGERVAIVGPSGSGKSTLLNLIPRFYDATTGRILVDGEDIRNLKIESLRALTGLVSQETILFNDTVRENIRMGLALNDAKNIEEAARVAHAHDFIADLPEGYDTIIGERGMKLSGGQRQRLALARAVLRDPSIFLLDEATSALDTQAEQVVQRAIEEIMHQRTSIIVAHRLSTIQRADRILVLDKGCIIEEGSHDALMNKQGLYYKLWQIQSTLPGTEEKVQVC